MTSKVAGAPIEKSAVGGSAGQRVAVPEIGLVNAVEHKVGQGNGEDKVFLFPSEKGIVFQPVEIGAGWRIPQFAGQMFIGDGQKAAGAAAGIVDGLARLRIDGMHHGADHLARGEKLAAVGVLLAHFQKQVFIHLGEGKEMGVVHMVDTDLVNLVEDVPQIGLRIDPHPLHGCHDAADDALFGAGIRIGKTGLRSISRPCR